MRDSEAHSAQRSTRRPERHRSELNRFHDSLPASSVSMLAREVIRRLSGGTESAPIPGPQGQDVAALAQALIAPYPAQSIAILDRLLDADLSAEQISRNHLAAALSRLGDMWDRDLIPFSSVMQGSMRTYMLLRRVRERRVSDTIRRDGHILMAAVPGESHAVGVQMAAIALREAGWDATLMEAEDHDGMIDEIMASDPAVVGLSCSGKLTAGALGRLIVALRIEMPDLPLLVGGGIVERLPEIVHLMGADRVVRDLPEALDAVAQICPPNVRRATGT